MRAIVKVPAISGLFLLLAALTSPLTRGAGPQLEFVSQWPEETRGFFTAAAARGGFLTVAAGPGGVQVFDLGNPAAPVREGELYGLPDAPTVLVQDGPRALVAGQFGSLAELDLSDPATPVLRWEVPGRSVLVAPFPLLGFTNGLAVAGYRAATGARNVVLEVWSFAVPGQPQRLAEVPTDQPFAWGNLLFDGTNAWFVLESGGGLFRLDVSNPAVPVASYLPLAAPLGERLSRSGNLVLATGSRPPALVDLSDPGAPVLVASNLFGGDFIRTGLLEGPRAYLAGRSNLWVLDVSVPASPVVLGSAPSTGFVWDVVRVSEQAVAVVSEADGVQIFDVADPAQPVLLDVAGSNGFTQRVEPRGAAVYAADQSALRVLDVTTPTAPVPADPQPVLPFQPVQDVALFGTTLAAGGASSQVALLSVTNPLLPSAPVVRTLSGFAWATSLAGLDDTKLLLGLSQPAFYGARVLEAQPGQPIREHDVRFNPGSRAAVVLGRGGDGGRVLALQNTSLVVLVPTNGAPYVAQAGRLALGFFDGAAAGPDPRGYGYIAGRTNGLLVVDATRPAQPQLVATNATRGPARGVTVRWPYVFVAEGFAGVKVFDAANPSNLVAVAHFDTRGEAVSTTLEGDLLYVADGARGVTILRWSSGRQPQTITPPPLLTRVTNSPPFALTAAASSGLPVSVRILEGPLVAAGDLFRTTNAAFSGFRETNKVVRLRFETPGSESYEPAFVDASFDVIRQPSASDKFGNWILANHPEFTAAQMHRKADPDGDGAFNEQEFVFGGNPAVANATDGRLSPPRVEFDGTRWVVRFAINVNPAYTTGPQRVTPQAAETASGPWHTLPGSQYRFEGSQLLITLPLEDAETARFVRVRLQQL
jgi:hypothetical protein